MWFIWGSYCDTTNSKIDKSRWETLFLCTHTVCVCEDTEPLPSALLPARSLWPLRQVRSVSVGVDTLVTRQQVMCSSVFTLKAPSQRCVICVVKVLICLCVCVCVAGQYTFKEGKNSPCLVYVSFNHKIYIYWKVELERMESTNLLKVLEEKPEFKSHLKALGVGECTHQLRVSTWEVWVQCRAPSVQLTPQHLLCLCLEWNKRPTVNIRSLLWLWMLISREEENGPHMTEFTADKFLQSGKFNGPHARKRKNLRCLCCYLPLLLSPNTQLLFPVWGVGARWTLESCAISHWLNSGAKWRRQDRSKCVWPSLPKWRAG